MLGGYSASAAYLISGRPLPTGYTLAKSWDCKTAPSGEFVCGQTTWFENPKFWYAIGASAAALMIGFAAGRRKRRK